MKKEEENTLAKQEKTIAKINKEKAESIAVCSSVKKTGRHFYKKLENGKESCVCGRTISIDLDKQKAFEKKVKELEKEAKKKDKAAKAKKEEEVAESWVKSIDFNQMFKLVGKTGLYSPATAKNKAGMVLFEEFLNKENRVWIVATDATCLNSYRFHLDKGGALSIYGVFENIEKNYNGIEGLDLNPFVMDLIVPGYDPAKFKDYHAVKVIDWFNYMKEKMVAYVEETEAEMKAEEVKEVETVKAD